MSYDCVLGWDFLVEHHLDIRGDALGDKWSYCLVGRHGKTLIHGDDRGHRNVSGVVETEVEGTDTSRNHDLMFVQSCQKAPSLVRVMDAVSIPGRCEMLISATIGKLKGCVGMIQPLEGSRNRLDQALNVAYTVVEPQGKVVIVKIMNTSNEPIELSEGTAIAEICPLVQSGSGHAHTQTTISAGVDIAIDTKAKVANEIVNAIDPSLPEREKAKLQSILLGFSDVFSEDLGHVDVVQHRIDTGGNTPIKQRPRRLPYAYRDEARKQISDMLAQNIIQPSSSPWSSPIVLVRKKDGQLRFCVDYRKLNQITRGDCHPLPRIDDTLDALKNAKLFTTLDCRNGYWQIPVALEDRQKTAFVTQGGLYEFLRMPFGLSTAPQTFQRAIEIILSGLNFEICLCYLDDVIIYSENFEQHCMRLTTVLSRFRQHNLRVKLAKCTFAAKTVKFLGHVISESGIRPDPEKIKHVRDIPPPNSVKEVRTFIGLAGYYRRFVAGFSTLAAPLIALTKKNARFNWTEECANSFIKL